MRVGEPGALGPRGVEPAWRPARPPCGPVRSLTASGSTGVPRPRAIRSMRRIIQRASSVNTTVIADEDQRLDLGRRGAGDVRLAGEHELAHRVEPDGERDRRDRERAERAQPPDREVEPGHEVHGLDHHVGHVERLAAPQQEQAREHHPEAVERGQREAEHGDDEAPLLDVERRRRTRSSR